jgi:large-conductance mechanosensitive channel
MDGLNDSVNELKRFIVDNNIVGTSAGVCIALAAKDGIQSLVGDIIIPTIVIVLKACKIDFLTKYLPVSGKMQLNVVDFVKQMITFILIIIISFIFVKFAFGYLLGVGYTKSNDNATVAGAASSNKDTKANPKANPKAKETFENNYATNW